MFSNLHWTNIVVILLLALFIFGDKLPNMIVEGLRLLRKLREMAQGATADLSKELGTEITLEDLHPKTFIRKHVLTEADQEAMLKPLKNFETDFKNVGKDAKDVVGDMNNSGAPTRATRAGGSRAGGSRAGGSRAGGSRATKAQPVAEQPAGPPATPPAEEAPAPSASYEDLP